MGSTLVIVLAETRAHEHTFDSFRRNLLEVYDADLALCVARNSREQTDNPFYRRARYVWTYDEPDDWGDAFDEARDAGGHAGDWRRLLEIENQWLGGVLGERAHPGSAGILLFFRWFLKRCLIRDGLIDRYDRFVVTRSDFVHPVPQVPLAHLDPRFVWIPDGEDYGGYTDRHLVAGRDTILTALSIADDIVARPDELHALMRHFDRWNLERYIRFSFERLGLIHRVRRYPYVMFSVRAVDGHTRWQTGVYSEGDGYFIKYPREHRGASIAGRIVRRPEHWGPRVVRLVRTLIGIDRRLGRRRERSKLWRVTWQVWDSLVLHGLTRSLSALVGARSFRPRPVPADRNDLA